MENIAQYTTVTQPLTVTGSNGSARQAIIVYLSFNCRTGGTDWPKLKQYFDAAEIRAGQGYFGLDSILHEHIDNANAHGIPYKTSWQLDPGEGIASQCDTYCGAYGVKGHRMSIAVERTYHGTCDAAQTRAALVRCEQNNGEKPELYILQRTLDEWGWPDWVWDYRLEIARYPYKFGTTEQYRYIEDFISERAWTFPKDATEAQKNIIEFWQAGDNIDAQRYFANPYTNDPLYRVGLKSGTFSVSTLMNVNETLAYLGADPVTQPPATDPQLAERVKALEDWRVQADEDMAVLFDRVVAMEQTETEILATLTDVVERLAALENAAPPAEDTDTMWVEVIGSDNLPLGIAVDHDVSCRKIDPNANPKGKPIIEHPPQSERIIYKPGDKIKVYKRFKYSCKDSGDTPTIKATGDVLHYVAVDGYPGVTSFVLASRVRKI